MSLKRAEHIEFCTSTITKSIDVYDCLPSQFTQSSSRVECQTQHTKQILYRCWEKRTKDDFTVNGFYLSGRLLFHLREIIRVSFALHTPVLLVFFFFHIARHPSNIWVSSKQTSYSQNKERNQVGLFLFLSRNFAKSNRCINFARRENGWNGVRLGDE